MKKVAITVIRKPYRGRLVGTTFNASKKDAKLLVALNLCVYAPESEEDAGDTELGIAGTSDDQIASAAVADSVAEATPDTADETTTTRVEGSGDHDQTPHVDDDGDSDHQHIATEANEAPAAEPHSVVTEPKRRGGRRKKNEAIK